MSMLHELQSASNIVEVTATSLVYDSRLTYLSSSAKNQLIFGRSNWYLPF